MVTYALIAAKAAYGYTKVSQTVGGGAFYNQYRPTSTTNPTQGTPYATLPAIFSQDKGLTFTEPSDYDTPSWFGAYDQTDVLDGDYLIGQQGTFFIANQQPESPFSPPRCVLCNAILNVLRQPEDTSGAVGVLPYGGDVSADEVMIMQGWPASVLETQRATTGKTKLPGDVEMPWNDVLMPSFASTLITQNDILVDATGRRYRISAAELTELGWRMRALVTMT
jgi:hypothetical protein